MLGTGLGSSAMRILSRTCLVALSINMSPSSLSIVMNSRIFEENGNFQQFNTNLLKIPIFVSLISLICWKILEREKVSCSFSNILHSDRHITNSFGIVYEAKKLLTFDERCASSFHFIQAKVFENH